MGLVPGIDWRLIEDQVVVWVGDSGATHALDPALSVLFRHLARAEGGSAAALAAAVAGEVAEDCQAAFPSWFEQALARLETLGMIAP